MVCVWKLQIVFVNEGILSIQSVSFKQNRSQNKESALYDFLLTSKEL